MARTDSAEQVARRVAIVHRQTRLTLEVAMAFTIAAGVAAAVPHETGSWLPLHLFLVGGLVAAISGSTQFLAVTWSAAAPPSDSFATTQRTLLTLGVVGLAIGRKVSAPPVLLAIAGSAVIVALVLLGVALLRIRRSSRVDRFHPAIDGYLVAVVLGLVGCGVGIALASDDAADRGEMLRSAHLALNLLGLVGIVIAVTLPFMVATQIRSKMAPRATQRAIRSLIGLLAAATVLASAGLLRGLHLVASVGLGLYAVGIIGAVALCPRIRVRHIRWAGPRLGLLAMGVVWWFATTAALSVDALNGEVPPIRVVLALIVGGYGQILMGSLAYLAPVLRGGGHVRLSAGFRSTASPMALIVANGATLGALTGAELVMAGCIAIWLVDTAVRAALLFRNDATTTVPDRSGC